MSVFLKLIFFLILSFLSLMGVSQTFLAEDFSSGQMPPYGWSIENASSQWTVNSSGFAGGTSPEARFQWIQEIGSTLLISPSLDLSGFNSIHFQFRHMYDDYQGEGPAVGVATRSGNGDWHIVWDTLAEGNLGPELIEFEISNEDVGQPDFQICCFILGDLFNLDYWYVDDIRLFVPFELDISLFLEGPFQLHEMTTHLNSNGYLPLSQPFGTSPWHYYGQETIESIPNPDVVDWVLLDLMKYDPDTVPAYQSVVRKAAFLLKDGRIRDLDGINIIRFDIPLTENLYVWVHQRNHLAVMSSEQIDQFSDYKKIDFTHSFQSAMFGKYALKKLSSDQWGIASGDGNADGQINLGDKYEVWMEQEGNTGYYTGDFNLDGAVDYPDIDKFWEPNSGKAHWVPDTTRIPFICGDTLFDSRDGQTYQTIQIGEQCWMEENLNFETGTNWCYYNSADYCDLYGRLYNWSTIMIGAAASNSVPSGVQGICPEGWHLPSDAEWCILTQFIDQSVDCSDAGYTGTDGGMKMKSTWGWSSGGNGTNASGFNALPGGCMGIYHFDDLLMFSYFWSTTDEYPGYARLIKLNYGLPSVGRYFSTKNRGYSVRCIKD